MSVQHTIYDADEDIDVYEHLIEVQGVFVCELLSVLWYKVGLHLTEVLLLFVSTNVLFVYSEQDIVCVD